MPDPKQVINNFLDQTIKKAGYDKVPQGFLDNYKKKLEELLMQKIGLEITKLLDKKAQDDLVEFLKSFGKEPPKPDEVFKFYNSRIPDFTEKIKGIMKEFQKEYVERAKRAKS